MFLLLYQHVPLFRQIAASPGRHPDKRNKNQTDNFETRNEIKRTKVKPVKSPKDPKFPAGVMGCNLQVLCTGCRSGYAPVSSVQAPQRDNQPQAEAPRSTPECPHRRGFEHGGSDEPRMILLAVHGIIGMGLLAMDANRPLTSGNDHLGMRSDVLEALSATSPVRSPPHTHTHQRPSGNCNGSRTSTAEATRIVQRPNSSTAAEEVGERWLQQNLDK